MAAAMRSLTFSASSCEVKSTTVTKPIRTSHIMGHPVSITDKKVGPDSSIVVQQVQQVTKQKLDKLQQYVEEAQSYTLSGRKVFFFFFIVRSA